MMARFCAYVDKVFGLGSRLETLSDARRRPRISTAAVFASALTMFATRRGSLHGFEQDLHIPSRLQGLVGPRVPSADTIGRVYSLMDPEPLRKMLRDIGHQLKRNKVFPNGGDWYLAAVDGHEFFRQPETLLWAMPDPDAHGRRAGSHRVLSPRRGLPSGGA